jgi:hypothetical protein
VISKVNNKVGDFVEKNKILVTYQDEEDDK